MESLSSNKELLRCSLKKMRAALPALRRERAKAAVTAYFQKYTPLKRILSFASFGSEIDTSELNVFLASKGTLYLPKISGEDLTVFQVEDLKSQLVMHPLGFLEPDPHLCTEVSPSTLEMILVPALGFDEKKHRLGYGKGFYDRFLTQYPQISTVGIGFHEQYLPELPTTFLDRSLDKVCLF